MANTTESAKLDDLPAEMICEVLRRLSLEDLVRLKMTAKRYLQIVSDFRVKQLDVGFHKTSESIDHCQPTLFVLQFIQPTLSRLQMESKGWIEYAVTRILDSEERLLYRGERRCLSPKQIRLRTCSLDCLGELADYFENL